MTFSENLRRIRVEKGLTQVEVSKLVGITQSGYSYLECGGKPTYDTLVKLAKVLEVSVDELSK